jgi:alpha-1,2-mannosyltransferase
MTAPRLNTVSLTRSLAVFLLLNGLLLNGLVWIASPDGYKETTLQHSWDVLRMVGSDDSWNAMALALEHFRSEPTTPIYRAVFFDHKIKFQYPPSSLFALMALEAIAPAERVRITDQDVYAWPTINDIVGLLFLVLTATATAALLERRLRQECAHDDSRTLTVLRIAIVFGLALTFYPLVKAFTLGQIQVWINGLFAVALLCWATGRPIASGTLMGLLCLIKPHYGLFVIWAMLRKEWRFAFACMAMGATGLIGAIAVFGWSNHFDYLPVLSHLAERGETYYPNHSVNGLLNRLMSVSEPELYRNLAWGDGSFPPFNRWVYWTTTLSSAAILLLAIMRRDRDNDPGHVVDFCTMAVSCAVAAPIAWEHHYGILFPVFAVVLAGALRSRGRLFWLVACYALASNYFIATQLAATTYWNVVQSYLLFAVLLLLLLLHLRPLPAAPVSHTMSA